MPVAQPESGYYLDTARELAAHVAAYADRIDLERQIPSALAKEIADKGFFRLLVPRSLGGAEMDHMEFLQILEVFAEADASTAWCINQNNVFATDSVRMPEPLARKIWDDGVAVMANGPPAPSATAIPVDGGYRLSGRWDFSSGSTHATWISATALVRHPDQKRDAGSDRAGARVMLIPKEEVKFLDFWQVNGLRGTGSFSFEVDDLFVPSTRNYSPTDPVREDGALYVIPRTLLFGSGFATVALGVARASLGTAIDVAVTKTPERTSTLLGDQSATHRIIGEAEAIWRSARAFLQESASSVWKSACENHALGTDERIRLRLASTHAIRMAAQVVDISYNLCGSDAIFETNPIQRRFQDIHVITQHSQGRLSHYETAGQFLLGLEPGGNF